MFLFTTSTSGVRLTSKGLILFTNKAPVIYNLHFKSCLSCFDRTYFLLVKPLTEMTLMNVVNLLCILTLLSTLAHLVKLSNEPVHEISNNVVCATSKASDQPAHTPSLIGSGSTRPEVKSAPESTRPWVNSAWVNSARCIFRAFSYVNGLFCACIFFQNLSFD